jgi:hypothetical protein
MLTLEEINTRVPACRKCKGRFHVVLPDDAETIARFGRLLRASRIEFIRALREATHSDLTVAKGVGEHATASGSCRRCRGPIPVEHFSDCEGCGSLNIRLDAIAGGG